LCSVSTRTIETAREELTVPDRAIWEVPGLRAARILLDTDNRLHALQREAVAFRWEPLQEAANAYASYEMAGYAEEAHKLLAGLERCDASALAYASLGILLGLTRAVAVQRGLMIESENRYFQIVEEAVGPASSWTRHHRILTGSVSNGEAGWPMRTRGLAALHLYLDTVRLLEHILLPGDAHVVQHTVAGIASSGLVDPS
jgi:hypothetical protein